MKRLGIPWRAGALAGLLLLFTAGAATAQPTIATDKDNYAVGNTVHIAGTGWTPSDTVFLSLFPDTSSLQRTDLIAVANGAGEISNQEFVVGAEHANVGFYLEARDRSGRVAQTGFFDGDYIQSVTTDPQFTSPVAAGSLVHAGVTVQSKHMRYEDCHLDCYCHCSWFCCWSCETHCVTYTYCTSPTVGFAAYGQGVGNGPSDIHVSFTPSTVVPSNCYGTATMYIQVPTCVSGGYYTIEVRAYDVNNPSDYSTTYVSFSVNTETTPPYVSVSGSLYVDNEPDACFARITNFGASASDNCCLMSLDGSRSDGLSMNDPFPAATPTTVTWWARDCHGNSSQASQTVYVRDRQAPRVDWVHDVSANTDPGACSATISVEPPHVSDNCGYTSQATRSDGRSLSDPFSRGSTTIDWAFTDAAGNRATATQTVAVWDREAPVIVMPSERTIGTDPGTCVATAAALGAPEVSDNCAVASVFSDAPASLPKGVTVVTWTATDAAGNQASATEAVTVEDREYPVMQTPTNRTVLTDPGRFTAVVNFAPGVSDNCPGAGWSASPPSGYTFPVGTTVVECAAWDSVGNRVTGSFTVTVQNPAPAAAITGPTSGAVFPVNTPVTLTGTFTDNPGDTHIAQWMIDGVASAGTVDEAGATVLDARSFDAAGVYLVTLTVTDQCGGSGTASTVDGLEALIVIYDPAGGFVTGGGWIDSPAGALAADPALTGRANFGFVSKYAKGATVPSGETEFQFKVANLNFHSSLYEWLVVSGIRAQYKGTGMINGAGTYGFLLTAIDGGLQKGEGGPDRFRIKIIDKASGTVVYDNMLGAEDGANPTTVLGGGSIVVHSTGGGPAGDRPTMPSALEEGTEAVEAAPSAFASGPCRPNPFRGSTSLRFGLPVACRVTLAVFDVTGREVQRLEAGTIAAGWHLSRWVGDTHHGMRAHPGLYFLRLTAVPAEGGSTWTAFGKAMLLD